MLKRIVLSAALLSVATHVPAAAQSPLGGKLSLEPYVGYTFFGELTEDGPELEADITYGGRAAYQLSPQWAVFGNYQRSNPEFEGSSEAEVTVDHWSGGVEFSYVPRGGPEGMLPIILEAGLGQTRYDGAFGDPSDLAVKLGLSSALQLTPNLGVRYGVDDYISNFESGGEDNIVNQFTVRAGVEVTF